MEQSVQTQLEDLMQEITDYRRTVSLFEGSTTMCVAKDVEAFSEPVNAESDSASEMDVEGQLESDIEIVEEYLSNLGEGELMTKHTIEIMVKSLQTLNPEFDESLLVVLENTNIFEWLYQIKWNENINALQSLPFSWQDESKLLDAALYTGSLCINIEDLYTVESSEEASRIFGDNFIHHGIRTGDCILSIMKADSNTTLTEDQVRKIESILAQIDKRSSKPSTVLTNTTEEDEDKNEYTTRNILSFTQNDIKSLVANASNKGILQQMSTGEGKTIVIVVMSILKMGVDSMLLDKGETVLYLSHEIAGIDAIEFVYTYIWSLVNSKDMIGTDDDRKSVRQCMLDAMYGLISMKDISKCFPPENITNVHEIWNKLKKENIIDSEGRLLTRSFARFNQLGNNGTTNDCGTAGHVINILKDTVRKGILVEIPIF
ncbi:unnamed protein product [Mytilus edulis]|uniref:Uncharacterized protein n=1 Tax=Mytilus edulis TaxID=6550 RepID=A0A8S3S1M7_MYTED|nr:unnamed protein product [Mytilus edulis]